ncbi:MULTISPECIES: carbohydrate deacetylase [Clostridium]|jgi:chitin disaccharide deacetylase|uniref:Carbohydrate deacetylase n=1 Tax=Clostridium tertium TaxID=1559 RepID=A0A9X3XNT5_9CLOT|nr:MULTISPECIES: carbohydrate deacetylase [Clostridium]EEH96606.1 hypothetical protein CSBG_00232 [Clostridium sp. 7_2_43FAA]MDB1934576.1 carbohydrate deacetylase [Clostridium tertium]MDB1937560.1 carbohydrate deacetylase [Clostridium tertium]MDB1939336.1 carbohydrate deacetylase [Clostridium tertium]MDB1969886.1 carbohydrate deacetylase [Clostridium tertium]
MKKVIINADDFGYSSAVNLGIIKSYKEGILTSTTLMANMPGRDEAIMLAKENPDLGVGGHLVLTCGKPLTKGTSLIDGNGDFYSLAEYKKHRNEMCDEEIFQEWSHQIDYLMDHGLQLTHLDSHHHVHSFPENLEVTKRIAEKYHLCFRNVFGLEENIELPNQKKIKGFLDLMNHSAIRDLTIPFKENRTRCFEEIQTVLDQVADNEITELMVHPAYVDEILYFNSSFNIQRMKEVSILCDSQMKQLFEENQIVTCSYKNV